MRPVGKLLWRDQFGDAMDVAQRALFVFAVAFRSVTKAQHAHVVAAQACARGQAGAAENEQPAIGTGGKEGGGAGIARKGDSLLAVVGLGREQGVFAQHARQRAGAVEKQVLGGVWHGAVLLSGPHRGAPTGEQTSPPCRRAGGGVYGVGVPCMCGSDWERAMIIPGRVGDWAAWLPSISSAHESGNLKWV